MISREQLKTILFIYLAIMTIVGFLVMFIDKRRAIKKQWRIKESTLFLVSLIGGSLGTWLGMYMCRHKTKHLSFVIGMPAILAVHIFLLIKFII